MALTKVTYSMIKGAPLNILDYGAVDGTDSTIAIQNALNDAATFGTSVIVPPGVYTLTDTLTVNASLLFDGGRFTTNHTIKINGNACMFGVSGGGITFTNGTGYIAHTPNNYDMQVLCGLDSTWSGVIDGLLFDFDNLAEAYVINFWNCDGFEFSNNRFINLYSSGGGSIIWSPNSSTGITGTMPRLSKNGKIFNNTLIFKEQVSGAQMAGVFQSTNISFFDNTFIGGGDDIINITSSDRISFNNNYCSTRAGSVLVSQSTNFSIIGNQIIKENAKWKAPSPSYLAGGIFISITDISQTFSAKNGVVIGNLIVNNDADYDMVQPLLVAGVENVVVADNILINSRANANFTFTITNSSAIVPTSTLYNKNLIVKNNTVVNGRILANVSGGSASDGVICVNNVSNGSGYADYPMNLNGFSLARKDYAANNIGMGATSKENNLLQQGSLGFFPKTLMSVFSASGITSSTVDLLSIGGAKYFYVPQDTALDQVNIQFSAPIADSCIIFLYTYNGVTSTNIGTWTLITGTKSKNAIAVDEETNLSLVIVPAGSAIWFSLVPNGNLGTVSASLNLYGNKFVFG